MPAALATPAEDAVRELGQQVFTPTYCEEGGAGGILGFNKKRRTIGIWTFDRDRIPVSANVADRIYEEALNTLLHVKPACVDVLDGEAIRDIAEHLKRTGAFREAGENPLLALEKANRTVNVLIRGEIKAQAQNVYLSFRAVDREGGTLLGQSNPWPLPDDYVISTADDAALTLDVALKQAANMLAAKASNMTTLVPMGVYFQDGDAQPPLGRYVLQGFLTAIENEKSNLISGDKLKVIAPELFAKAKSGDVTTMDDFDPLAMAPGKISEGVHELTGRYWILGDAMDLKLSLRAKTGESVAWQGKVRLAGLPGVAADPRNTSLSAPGESAFLLQVTSPRGAAPYYQVGEALTTFVRSAKDAYLTCFYLDVNGVAMMVLPNSFQDGVAAQNQIAANKLKVLPDPKTDGFEFRFTQNTLGEEMLRCYATTRNPAKYLPRELRSAGFKPLDADLAARLPAIFHAIPQSLTAEAQLTVTVGTEPPPAKPSKKKE